MSERKRTGLRGFLRGLYDPDPTVRWAAVRGIGEHAAARWESDPAGVRELVRRFTWALSDESGATPWGAPESVGEILARVPDLRPDFARLYAGWLTDEEVLLGNDRLDAGALWAIGRLGPGDPFDPAALAPLLRPFLAHPEPTVRAAAAFAVARHGVELAVEEREAVRADGEPVVLLIDGEVVETTPGEVLPGRPAPGPSPG